MPQYTTSKKKEKSGNPKCATKYQIPETIQKMITKTQSRKFLQIHKKRYTLDLTLDTRHYTGHNTLYLAQVAIINNIHYTRNYILYFALDTSLDTGH